MNVATKQAEGGNFWFFAEQADVIGGNKKEDGAFKICDVCDKSAS